MLFTRLKISNFFCFDNSELDLSYSKKVNDITIENEYLEGRPYFNIKKVCIISGPNASGKTSLGVILRAIQNLLYNNQESDISILSLNSAISDKTKPASIEVDFVVPKGFMAFRLKMTILNHNVSIILAHAPILMRDSCYSSRNKLDQIIESKKSEVKRKGYGYEEFKSTNEVEKYFKGLFVGEGWWYGWFYSILDNVSYSENNINSNELVVDVLEKVMRTFDRSIAKIEANNSIDDKGNKRLLAFIITFYNNDKLLINSKGDVLPVEGSDIDKNRLSRGTYDSIRIANFIARVCSDAKKDSVSSETYFLDEGMNFIHTELEQAILNLIISKLHPNAQFFYTTHNYDIFEMNLPAHSFIFLYSERGKTVFTSADTFKKKNDRSLLPYVKANYFKTTPDTTLIDELLFED